MTCADVEQQQIEPRGLSRTGAASYVGVFPTLFDQMVEDGRMPQPNSQISVGQKTA